ncbi:MAG: glycosyltransferase [Bacteroidetes bacterium]|nr:glycosyltransferase [Bacteroidota bacterium]
MKTIIDFRLQEKFSPSIGAFMEQLWIDLAVSQPERAFVFLTEELSPPEYPPPISIRTVKRSSFGWLDRKRLLTLLEEENAAVYVSFSENSILVHQLHGPAALKNDLRQPTHRIVFSGADALLAAPASGNSKAPLRYLSPALPGVLAANALSWTETESIRTQYAGGKEYFLFTGDIDAPHRLLDLLKAFSLFKKRQQSNMQLVIAGYETQWTGDFEEKLATYKYRTDVAVLKELEWPEIRRLAAAAYAIVYPAITETLPLAPLLALQAGVPLVSSDLPVVRELTDAAEWVDNNRFEEGFSQGMMLLYKDETHRQQLLRNAAASAARISREQLMEALGEIIGPYPLPLNQ